MRVRLFSKFVIIEGIICMIVFSATTLVCSFNSFMFFITFFLQEFGKGPHSVTQDRPTVAIKDCTT